MSISEKIEKIYSSIIKNIKKMKKGIEKDKSIGALIADLGKRSINAVANKFNICWRKAKSCYDKFLYGISTKEETRGRKTILSKYPELEDDIHNVLKDFVSVDPRFKSEILYVKATIKEIKKKLIETGKYTDKSFSNSKLNNIVNELGYSLKKVNKTKPLKKIKETDAIFENVNKKKEEAMQDENTVLISIDTKDKVLIGPFSRKGKNRFEINAVDHELTNNCLIPFGILDIKKNIPYFFNYTKKPTSLDIVECIEEFFEEQYKDKSINKLMILLDNGPDNSGVRTVFLKALIDIAIKYNITIELVYYPPYHSKYNPVERLWARLENIWNGYLLTSVNICLNFMKNLTWKENKSVTKLKEVKYEKGMTIEKKEMKELENKYIHRAEKIKKWSIIITP